MRLNVFPNFEPCYEVKRSDQFPVALATISVVRLRYSFWRPTSRICRLRSCSWVTGRLLWVKVHFQSCRTCKYSCESSFNLVKASYQHQEWTLGTNGCARIPRSRRRCPHLSPRCRCVYSCPGPGGDSRTVGWTGSRVRHPWQFVKTGTTLPSWRFRPLNNKTQRQSHVLHSWEIPPKRQIAHIRGNTRSYIAVTSILSQPLLQKMANSRQSF